ncbi:outer membrane family protein [Helicobacter pylori SouthAfrica20]|uniref:Outer membrane family protein n=1 Tax=Helicobacter pylori SouthAfrica20 TaxID=1352356 RepID=T1UC25_HELPX|nr:outer membrane family protein [Helicobacter pylori SouthAfrica20]
MKKLFTSLLLFSILESNQKNGFFIEAGFETGLLEGTQTQEKKYTTTKNTYATYDYLPTDAVLKRAANLFTDAEAISKLKFSSLSPVRVLYMYNGQLTIENFLPYNLSNVKLSFTDAQGNIIDLGVIEIIPKHSKIVLPGEVFDSLKVDPYTLFLPKIEATSTQASDANTQRVFEALNKIKTNLVANYRNENKFKDHENHWEAFTPKTAEEFTNLMLNMIAVLDSQSWGDAILNAPFEFTNKGGEGECDTSKNNDCVNPGTNGVVNSQDAKQHVLNKQDIVDKFRNKTDLDVTVLKDSSVVGLGSNITPDNNDDGKHYGQLGVVASALEPKKLFSDNLKTINLQDLRIILHEFSHTKGYTHNGNMTYQRVPNGQTENGKPKDTDGLPYNVCSRFNGPNQPAFPSNYPNSIYHNCADVPAGFVGVTTAVWQQLINQNALPIDYANLSSQKNYNLNATLNTQDLANSMLNTIQKTFVTSSVTNYHASSSSQNFRSPILGVNAKIGYQNYFNDFIGLAYYGIIKYNYAKASSEKVQQLSYGGGVDLLLDFITTYTNKNQNDILVKRNFSSSFGIFGGLRGLYNSYYVLNKVKGSGNLDVATGLNYRHKHSKYSVGISIPLIQRKASVVSANGDYTNSFVFNEGAGHFKVFFNYGWIF